MQALTLLVAEGTCSSAPRKLHIIQETSIPRALQLLNLEHAHSDSTPFCYFDENATLIPLTYAVLVPQCHCWIKAIGVNNVNSFCTHSFRHGGTPFAFQCAWSDFYSDKNWGRLE